MKIRDCGFSLRREGDVAVLMVRMAYAGQAGCDLHGNEARKRFIKWILDTASGMLFDPGSDNERAFAEAAVAYCDACVEDEDSELPSPFDA